MGRLIDPVPRNGSLFAGGTPSAKANTYLERVAKYVPAEVIIAYLTLLPIVQSGTDAGSGARRFWLTVIFAIGVLFTPLYLWRFPGELRVKWYHLVISTLAFVVWVYSIRGGFFDDRGLYSAVGAAVTLVVFSLASGLFAPTAE